MNGGNSLGRGVRAGIVGSVVEDHFAGIAAQYDERLGPMGDPAVIRTTVDVLAELAAGGAA